MADIHNFDSEEVATTDTSVCSMGGNSNNQYGFYDSDRLTSSTETWSWGEDSSSYSTLTIGSSSESNISDMQKLRGMLCKS